MQDNFSNPNNQKIRSKKRLWYFAIIPVLLAMIGWGLSIFLHYDEKFSKTDSKGAIESWDTNTSIDSTETNNGTTGNTNNFAYLKYDTIDISDTSYTTEINKNEIGAFTCGPALINNNYLPGGANPDRGSVIIILPENSNSTSYTFEKLVPSHNWFGVYTVNEINDANLQYIINERIDLMKKSPNGTSGLGCKIIDVLVLSGQNNLFKKTYQY